MVSAYVGEASPVGSSTLSHLLPVPLSSASIRSTMAELAELGLLAKPHASAGRVPTGLGLRLFVDELVPRR
ncbi:MAG TPA: heat-inducible transcriptional repressor HrcA, partial [Myxococcota bacterium]|nr:heat-inducible transcriptional repressor HrcA [Myxococcota bacterium]